MSPQFLELCHYIMMVPMTKKAAADLVHELDLWHLNRFLYHLLHLSFGLRSLENYQQCGRDPAAASWNDEEMTMKPDRNRQKSQPISNWFRGIIVQKPSTMGRSWRTPLEIKCLSGPIIPAKLEESGCKPQLLVIPYWFDMIWPQRSISVSSGFSMVFQSKLKMVSLSFLVIQGDTVGTKQLPAAPSLAVPHK